MKHVSTALLLLLVSACAAPGSYPSLAKRPFEKPPAATPEPPPPPPVASDPALLARVDAALKLARDAAPTFDAALPSTRRAAERAASATPETEPWIEGQLMISRLDQLAGSAREALSALDDERRALDQRPGSPDRPALDAAFAEVEAIDARQTAAIRELLTLIK